MLEKLKSLEQKYTLVDRDQILPEEIIDLRKSIGWEEGDTEEGWKQSLETALAVVGARDTEKGELVGVGFLVGNLRHAVLCDFNVSPKYQGQGIGSAILDERMRIAEELDIPYLYTSLAETNPLRDKYRELGFVATGDTYFRET